MRGREIPPEDLPPEILESFTFGAAGRRRRVEPRRRRKSRVEIAWDRMIVKGESFWTVVYPDFIDRELTKTELRQLIRPACSAPRAATASWWSCSG